MKANISLIHLSILKPKTYSKQNITIAKKNVINSKSIINFFIFFNFQILNAFVG